MPSIQCHITKVSQDVGSEWGKISTDHDQIKTLQTKIAEKIREAAGFKESGELVELEYTSNPRTVDTPNGPRTYQNNYYERAGSIEMPSSNGGIPGLDIVQPQGRSEDPVRAWRIALQNGTNAAVATLPLMPVDQRDFETQKRIALAWAEFTYFTPLSGGDEPSPFGAPGAHSEHDGPPPYSDQDIPF